MIVQIEIGLFYNIVNETIKIVLVLTYLYVILKIFFKVDLISPDVNGDIVEGTPCLLRKHALTLGLKKRKVI